MPMCGCAHTPYMHHACVWVCSHPHIGMVHVVDAPQVSMFGHLALLEVLYQVPSPCTLSGLMVWSWVYNNSIFYCIVLHEYQRIDVSNSSVNLQWVIPSWVKVHGVQYSKAVSQGPAFMLTIVNPTWSCLCATCILPVAASWYPSLAMVTGYIRIW